MASVASDIEQFELMLFRVNGALFGCELGQVGGVFTQEEHAATGEERTRLDCFFFGKQADMQVNWKFIKPKEQQAGELEWGVLAEEPEDIVKIAIDDIRPLPVMIEKLRSFKSIWGSFIYKGEIGLLLDLARLGPEIRSSNAND